jgi:DNA-binding response OmpR family regulator
LILQYSRNQTVISPLSLLGKIIMKNILIIEDDPFLTDIYETKFKGLGFSVDIARDGEEGLEKLKEKDFDVLILDIVLPHINGWEVLRQIEEDGKFKKLKIIILSNLGQEEEIKKGLKLGAIKYLIKAHYTPQEVVDEVKKLLK